MAKGILLLFVVTFSSFTTAEDLELAARLYFQEADYHAQKEPDKLKKAYFEITEKFDQYIEEGRGNELLNEYSYLAYRGSLGSIVRLCVMFGLGIGTEVEEIQSWRWCTKGAEMGLSYLPRISSRAHAIHYSKPGNILE